MTDRQINLICKMIINKSYVDKKYLNYIGLTEEDIKELLKEQTLKEIEYGKYTLRSAKHIYQFGLIQTLVNKNNQYAEKCFKRALEIEPDNINIIFRLFFCRIINKNYKDAFEYFDLKKELDENDYLYLYLLNIITNLPPKYKELAHHITLDDVIYKVHVNTEIANLKNKMKILAYSHKFSEARNTHYKLNKLYRSNNKETPTNDYLLLELISQAKQKTKKEKLDICALIKEKNYESALDYYKSLEEKRQLSDFEKEALRLIHIYLNKGKNLEHPQQYNKKTLDLKISSNDFKDALLLLSTSNNFKELFELIEKYNLNYREEPLFLILLDLKPLITENKTTNTNEISQDLINGNIETALEKIKIYLKSINKYEYRHFIFTLIKIELLKNKDFTSILNILKDLQKNTFNIDITSIIKLYKEEKDKNDELASYYFELIKEYIKLTKNNKLNSQLYNIVADVLCGSDILSSCKNYNLDENKTTIALIIFAREYFFLGDIEKAEELIQLVEEKDNISQTASELLERLKNNRLNYQNFPNKYNSLLLV